MGFERPKSVILRRLDVDLSKWIQQSLIIYHIRYYLFISATDSLSPLSQILQVFNVLSKIESWNRWVIFLRKKNTSKQKRSIFSALRSVMDIALAKKTSLPDLRGGRGSKLIFKHLLKNKNNLNTYFYTWSRNCHSTKR